LTHFGDVYVKNILFLFETGVQVDNEVTSSWDGSKNAPPSNTNPKVSKEYQRCVEKAISIIGLNLVGNQLADIKSSKRHVKA
jgi:hypothetical protein